MTYTDSADTSDKDIDSYLYGKKPGSMTDTGEYGSPQGKNGTQQSSADIDKILSSMPKMPEPPKLHDLPKPSEQNYTSPYQGFSGPMLFLAALGSLMTRHPAQTTMNSFTAMVNANVKGQQQQMEEARENWKASMDWTVKQNEIELDRYKLIMEKYKENSNAMIAHMMTAASGFNDPIMAAAARAGDLNTVWNLLQDRQTQSDKLREFSLKQEEQNERERHNRAEEKSLGKNPQSFALQQFMEEHKDDNDGAGPNAQQIQQFIQQTRPPRSAPAMFIQKFMEEHQDDHDGAGPTADELTKAYGKFVGETQYQRTGGGYAARVESASNEVAQVAPLALQSSAGLPRGEWVPLNTLMQKFQAGTSDPRYYQFAVNNFSLKNAYTRAMNPTGSPRVAERVEQRADHLFDMATDPASYKVMVQNLIKEVQASKRAIAAMRSGNDEDMNKAMEDILNGGTGLPAGSNPDLGPTNKSGWSIEKVQ